MDLNAIYLSLYCCFSIVILIYYFFISPGKKIFQTRILVLLLCMILAISIILLSAKMVIAILALVIISLLLYIGLIKGQLLKSAVLILMISVAGVVAIGQIHYVRWRIGVTLLKKYEGAEDNQNGLAVRQMLWQSAVELIKQRPILGFGIQSAETKLLEKYEEKNFEYGLAQRYNAHNTYLQVTLHCGMVGLIILLLLLAVTIRRVFTQKNFFLFFLLLIILPQSITESMFEVQKGIVFFVTFVCLLANHSYNEKIALRLVSEDSKQPIRV
jgi:O-antigen ligase